jgi:hypothetical protein
VWTLCPARLFFPGRGTMERSKLLGTFGNQSIMHDVRGCAPGRLVGEKRTTAGCGGAAATNRDGKRKFPCRKNRKVCRQAPSDRRSMVPACTGMVHRRHLSSLRCSLWVQLSGRTMLTRPSRQCIKAHSSYNNVKSRICKYWEFEVQWNYFPGER